MEALGLEYRYLALYLQKQISKKELMDHIELGNVQYARRQMQWFKRDERIKWFEPTESKEILSFLKKLL